MKRVRSSLEHNRNIDTFVIARFLLVWVLACFFIIEFVRVLYLSVATVRGTLFVFFSVPPENRAWLIFHWYCNIVLTC